MALPGYTKDTVVKTFATNGSSLNRKPGQRNLGYGFMIILYHPGILETANQAQITSQEHIMGIPVLMSSMPLAAKVLTVKIAQKYSRTEKRQ